jgi:probable RNA-binding protein EIF1AD
MAPPRRKLLATEAETLTPPDLLPDGHHIAKVLRATGNNIYSAELPSKEQILVVLPARFRSTIWMKRGSYVVVDMNALEPKDRISGEIVNIVRDEKAWRKAPYWYGFLSERVVNGSLTHRLRPKEFAKQQVLSDSDDEESTVGKLPPSDDEEES